GTIAMRQDNGAGGAVLALTAADLAGSLRSTTVSLPEITTEEYGPLPSCQFTIDHLWGLRQRVMQLLQDGTDDRGSAPAIVITHGTDTLEETAYLLDLTVPSSVPVVITGAMRVASDPGYDGMANLLAAIRVASSPQSCGLGTLVVMNDEIHTARDVTKTDSQSLDTFQSPVWGPIGRVDVGQVRIARRIERSIIAPPRLEQDVVLLKLAVGMDADLVTFAVDRGAKGLVIETFGGGRVPPWWLEPIRHAAAAGVAVAVTTRCLSGNLGDPYRYEGAFSDLVEAGCLVAPGLNGPKARLRLMAALAAGSNADDVRHLYESDQSHAPFLK
ncbi:MAG TPA: asparaginase, partial [Anaerolineae bacterium]|nr:asparaginase [Anaerolineae bacterium]